MVLQNSRAHVTTCVHACAQQWWRAFCSSDSLLDAHLTPVTLPLLHPRLFRRGGDEAGEGWKERDGDLSPPPPYRRCLSASKLAVFVQLNAAHRAKRPGDVWDSSPTTKSSCVLHV
jgi:hypothetical protein